MHEALVIVKNYILFYILLKTIIYIYIYIFVDYISFCYNENNDSFSDILFIIGGDEEYFGTWIYFLANDSIEFDMITFELLFNYFKDSYTISFLLLEHFFFWGCFFFANTFIIYFFMLTLFEYNMSLYFNRVIFKNASIIRKYSPVGFVISFSVGYYLYILFNNSSFVHGYLVFKYVCCLFILNILFIYFWICFLRYLEKKKEENKFKITFIIKK